MPRWPLQAWAVGLSILSEQVPDATPASLSKSCVPFNFQGNFFIGDMGSMRQDQYERKTQ